jgi:hypothetical protein
VKAISLVVNAISLGEGHSPERVKGSSSVVTGPDSVANGIPWAVKTLPTVVSGLPSVVGELSLAVKTFSGRVKGFPSVVSPSPTLARTPPTSGERSSPREIAFTKREGHSPEREEDFTRRGGLRRDVPGRTAR